MSCGTCAPRIEREMSMPKNRFVKKKRQEAQRINVENDQTDKKGVEHRKPNIVKGVHLGKFQMLVPNQHQHGYAEQKCRKGLCRSEEIGE